MAYNIVLIRTVTTEATLVTRNLVHHIPDAKDDLKQARRWCKKEGAKLVLPGDRLEWSRVVGGFTAKTGQVVLVGDNGETDDDEPEVIVAAEPAPVASA